MNHHFWGDISAWFMKCIVGIQLNPNKDDVNTLKIKPAFITALEHASAFHNAPAGTITVSWKRENRDILLDVKIPEGICATAELGPDFCFEDGAHSKAVTSGIYKISRA